MAFNLRFMSGNTLLQISSTKSISTMCASGKMPRCPVFRFKPESKCQSLWVCFALTKAPMVFKSLGNMERIASFQPQFVGMPWHERELDTMRGRMWVIRGWHFCFGLLRFPQQLLIVRLCRVTAPWWSRTTAGNARTAFGAIRQIVAGNCNGEVDFVLNPIDNLSFFRPHHQAYTNHHWHPNPCDVDPLPRRSHPSDCHSVHPCLRRNCPQLTSVFWHASTRTGPFRRRACIAHLDYAHGWPDRCAISAEAAMTELVVG